MFYGTLTHVGYLMPMFKHILNIYDLLTNSLQVTFKTSQSLFVCTQLNGFKYAIEG